MTIFYFRMGIAKKNRIVNRHFLYGLFMSNQIVEFRWETGVLFCVGVCVVDSKVQLQTVGHSTT